jgi:hypothetical protein
MSASAVPPDEFFSALDGQCLSVDGRAWSVCVFSVTDANDNRWIQLALEGCDRKVLTLKLAPSQQPQHAFVSLSCFLTDPRAARNVLSHVV